ncbi:MAG: hypothetical protein IPN26_12150 [Bacteroidetes bacterium]|nr:hypothetical protein [Bacteroidota bacterium]
MIDSSQGVLLYADASDDLMNLVKRKWNYRCSGHGPSTSTSTSTGTGTNQQK